MTTARKLVVGMSLLFLSLAAAADDGSTAQAGNDPNSQTMQSRLNDLAGRVSRLEAQSDSQGILSLLNQVEVLETEVATLRGRLEELNHEQQLADKRDKDVLADFDARIKANHDMLTAASGAAAAPNANPAAAGAAMVPAAPGAPAGQSAPAPAAGQEAETKDYRAAFDLINAANYKAAVPAFDAFLKKYPNSTLAGNATYWLGLSYYSLGDYKNAAAAEQRLLTKFPGHAKVPDAMVSLARAEIQLGEMDKANQLLGQVIAKYPNTKSAEIATKIQSLLK